MKQVAMSHGRHRGQTDDRGEEVMVEILVVVLVLVAVILTGAKR